MTDAELRTVTILQMRGLGYKKIAAITSLPVNAVKSQIARHPVEPKDVCMECGQPLTQVENRRSKIFCCRTCKIKWWNNHPHMMKKQTLNSFVCPVCGKKFFDYGRRIYCSVSCYAEARRKNNG